MSIYICETYYHLLIAIIKNINSKGASDLIIFGDRMDNFLVDNDKLIDNLKETDIFRNIYVMNYKERFTRFGNKHGIKYQIYRYKFINRTKKYIGELLNKYNDIYLFNDISTIGKCVNMLDLKYILLEDGLDCYKNNYNVIRVTSKFKIIIKELLYGYFQLGQSKNIKYIEVNDKNELFIKDKKIKELKKQDLFASLSNIQKQDIFDIFGNKLKLDFQKDYSLLITQPLCNDKLLENESEQISLYRYIINRYLCNENVIIKAHPRESINYSAYFNNVISLEKTFPIEIIAFNSRIKINKIITVSSTSIELIDNCENKIKLGWDWFDKYKKEQK